MEFTLRETAHRGYLSPFRADLNSYIDPYVAYSDAFPHLVNLLNSSLLLRLRILLCMAITFFKISEEGERTHDNKKRRKCNEKDVKNKKKNINHGYVKCITHG